MHDRNGLLCRKCFERAIRKKMQIRIKRHAEYYVYRVREFFSDRQKLTYTAKWLVYFTAVVVTTAVSMSLKNHVNEAFVLMVIPAFVAVLVVPIYYIVLTIKNLEDRNNAKY